MKSIFTSSRRRQERLTEPQTALRKEEPRSSAAAPNSYAAGLGAAPSRADSGGVQTALKSLKARQLEREAGIGRSSSKEHRRLINSMDSYAGQSSAGTRLPGGSSAAAGLTTGGSSSSTSRHLLPGNNPSLPPMPDRLGGETRSSLLYHNNNNNNPIEQRERELFDVAPPTRLYSRGNETSKQLLDILHGGGSSKERAERPSQLQQPSVVNPYSSSSLAGAGGVSSGSSSIYHGGTTGAGGGRTGAGGSASSSRSSLGGSRGGSVDIGIVDPRRIVDPQRAARDSTSALLQQYTSSASSSSLGARYADLDPTTDSTRSSSSRGGGTMLAAAGSTSTKRSSGSRGGSRDVDPWENGWTRNAIGLRNLGNTCFLNSSIQCLLSIPPLQDFFRSAFSERDLNERNAPLKGKLAREFHALLDEARRARSGAVLSPAGLRQLIIRYAPQFSGYSQQDSHEVLRFLLDGLHEDLNRVRTKPKYQEMKDIKGESVDSAAARWWDYSQSCGNSVITDIFGGQLMNETYCGACGHKSWTFDVFLDLSLPIASTRSCDVVDCFRRFTEREQLDVNDYRCENCKNSRKISKRLSIYKPPRVLVVHLKRFSHSRFSREKLSTVVHFPTRGLDLSDVVEGRSGVYYDLAAVSQHAGSMGGGHYTAACKLSASEWACFSDSTSSPTSDRQLEDASAYVLFYVRK
ncbi:unnamed protein product [Amoebophrya sp. A25]|nr:unnamed protein product [Amoebophrya sp. A25]|eukprot:GSA25T00000637001.1